MKKEGEDQDRGRGQEQNRRDLKIRKGNWGIKIIEEGREMRGD